MDQEEREKKDGRRADAQEAAAGLSSPCGCDWFRLFRTEFESVGSIVALDYGSESSRSLCLRCDACGAWKKKTSQSSKLSLTSIFGYSLVIWKYCNATQAFPVNLRSQIVRLSIIVPEIPEIDVFIPSPESLLLSSANLLKGFLPFLLKVKNISSSRAH